MPAMRFVLPWVGILLAILLWSIGVAALSSVTPIAHAFAPSEAAQSLLHLLMQEQFWHHLLTSMKRVAIGMFFALLIGIPLGVLSGVSLTFARSSTPLFQLLRMISPLSWMPLAVMVLGVGDAPVYFLLTFAAVWPIVLNTSAGISQLDKNWLLLARSLSATKSETLFRVVLPGITAHILTGVRLSIGIIWIVLVPAEMLGVSAGLGYFILDSRDRMEYSELMATIIVIGILGYFLDHIARALHHRWLHSN
jgi:NitT/TauT family transport system permease protein